ncbi:MAG: hypothetical protein ACLGI6_07040, partial [Gammaproteobacteria bacterium]
QAQDALAAQSLKAALAPQQRALAALIQLQQAARVARYRSAAANEGTARVALGSADGGLERRAQGEWAGAMPPGLRALMAALDHPGPLPAAWKADAHAWIGARLPGEAQRLAAQRAVQDVDDGCGSCRAVLRAWLRAGVATGVPTGALALHGSPAIDTRFARAWRQGGAQ